MYKNRREFTNLLLKCNGILIKEGKAKNRKGSGENGIFMYFIYKYAYVKIEINKIECN